ncbi:proteasome activator [Pseudonocardia sp. N23]|uniref:proteasome activator n=1 Tax=Pseudonocardia sp. N23 TaxID=1987376 RepID=UPI000BFDF844|nr:proteasome activator [Pseudonocardia sp. N23]GAY07350.1 hypothetical protein TOK_2575 [Pseudonocardia sp. N23]
MNQQATGVAHPRAAVAVTDDEPITDPAKLLRLGGMVKQLLEELHAQPLDAAGRSRLVDAHAATLAEIEATVPAALRAELDEIAPHLRVGAAISDAELRIAQAQLVGWLEGVFQGVQFAMAVGGAGAQPESAGAPDRPSPRSR